MSRIDLLFETWTELNNEAEMAILAYDGGARAEGMAEFERIWQMFQVTFADTKDRKDLEEAHQNTMNMLLNRMYLDIEDTGDEERLWEFCQQVCKLFKPDEIWREDYVACIGRLLQKRKEYEACDQWFETCITEEPDNLVYMAHWAHCLVERGLKEQAERLLDSALAKTQRCSYFTVSFYRLAREVYGKMNLKERAELCKQRIIELDEELLLCEEEE